MNKRNLQNKKLNKIGQNLLDSAKMRDEEIEKIVTAPQLFSLVKTRIETEKLDREKQNIFANFPNLSFWNWQKIGVPFAVLIILTVFGILVFNQFNRSELQLAEINSMKISSQSINLETPKYLETAKTVLPNKKLAKTEKPKNFIAKTPKNIQPVAFKNNRSSSPDLKNQPRKSKQSVKPLTESDGVFYSLIIGEIPAELKENFSIIRVDMPRSSLIALGVNISPNNENPTIEDKIKTDLLVGFDGIPQAYRFVR